MTYATSGLGVFLIVLIVLFVIALIVVVLGASRMHKRDTSMHNPDPGVSTSNDYERALRRQEEEQQRQSPGTVNPRSEARSGIDNMKKP